MLHRILLAFTIGTLPVTLLAQSVTSVEWNDPRITYTGTWYTNTNTLEVGGSSALTNAKGAEAIVVFNGTGITWIGTSDGYAGECYVTLDGVQSTVDTSNAASATYYSQTLYSIHNLTAGMHRLTIDVLHQRDSTTQGSWIWVNAFNIDNGTLVGGTTAAGAGMALESNVAANYSGQWFQHTGSQYAGGAVNTAVDAGAEVDFTFTGTAVTWIGYRDQWSGIAQVLIDGTLQATVDTYLNPSQVQTPTYSVTGLSPGTHVLSIVATGTQDANSGGAWVWVNAFQVSDSAVTTEGAPLIGAGGVVSAASFAASPNNQVAPGQLISIFGQNFLASGNAGAGAFPLPTQLGPQNTTVTACGATFPLYYVLPGQINAQLPVECPTAGVLTATVTVGGQTATQTFTLAPAAPGIFTVNGSGSGSGVIVDLQGSLIGTTNPASAGQYVSIYATGLGATTPQFADGTAVNAMNNTVMPVTVAIGGKPATVTYAGLTEGWVGLYQINAIVPSGLTGSQPVVVTVGGTYSSPAGVSMSVQ
jgi:uncharacterized protein (TIGR03437 family)